MYEPGRGLAPFALALAACYLPATARAQDDRPPLRWGGDKNGGAPYIFEDDKGRLVGFEAEFAEYLGRELGRRPEFVQNEWNNLRVSLQNRSTDIVLNGYEYDKAWDAETPSTVPYYVYSLRLIVRDDAKDIASWADLGKGTPAKTVGALIASASIKYLQSRYGERIQLEQSVTVTEMLDRVRAGGVDATVQDAPAAAHYVQQGRYPGLKVIDDPVGFGYYAILTRADDPRHPENAELRAKLNEAIRKGIRTGYLRDLYKKYGIWNAAQQRLGYLADQPWPSVAEELEAEEEYRPLPPPTLAGIADKLFAAAGITLFLAFASFPLAAGLGLAVAVGRVYGPWFVRAPLTAYVEVLRGTPLLLQLFVIFYLPSQLGVITGAEWLHHLSPDKYVAAVLGLALNYSAAEAENYRAGLLAVPRGQMEAALSLGLTPATAVRRVVLPQAVRIVIPPVTNDFIALFKDTAICSTIMVVELTGLYYQYKIYPHLVLELAFAVGLLYLLMSYPLSLVARSLERRTSLTAGGRP